MAKTEPRTLAGFMELMPNEQILFEQWQKQKEKVHLEKEENQRNQAIVKI